MHLINSSVSRRRFIHSVGVGAAVFAAPGAFAEQLVRTPDQTEGPFYPDKLPLDTDNDLLIVNDKLTPAVGAVTHLGGRVLDASGNPVRNAVVEIWQVDANGIYLHSGSPGREKMDGNFQGFGRFLTGGKGGYYFRTIKPVAYGNERFGRTPHIHFAVNVKGKRVLATQCYIKGEPANERDGIFNSLKNPKDRNALLVDFKPMKKSTAGELVAKFDIVLGVTPAA